MQGAGLCDNHADWLCVCKQKTADEMRISDWSSDVCSSDLGAGMTGGMAFVFDPADTLPIAINDESVVYQRLASSYWDGVLRGMIEEHIRETQSVYAGNIFSDWDSLRGKFWQVCPKEVIARLEHPLSDAAAEIGRAHV